MIRTRGLTHLALKVRDPERAFAFYQDVFGAVAVYRERGFIQAQTPGSWDVLVFEAEPGAAGGSGGIAHFGFRLLDPGDIEAAARAVEAAGGQIVSRGEFVPGEPYLFCRDPDGYDLEIWYELPTPADPVPTQMPVSLREILEGMEFQSDEVTAYLHRPTGRVLSVSDEALQAAEEGAGAESGVEEFELTDARGIVEAGDDYLPLPDRLEIDEYRMMERFAAGVADPAVRAELGDTLRGQGAFRRFKDAVRRFGVAEEWYRYRDRGYEDVARAWCEAHGLVLNPPAADA